MLLALASCAAACSPDRPCPSPRRSAPPPLRQRTRGQPASLSWSRGSPTPAGFVAKALYVDDDGRPRGARFFHERTRFVFDYLAIESAPQAFVYATTYPTSDGGAPHTQEHLLLGKGNKGRWLGNYDHVMLADWSAATWQYRTGYHFHTSAGTDAFWGILRTQLDALLHPDYSDEDIRREVRNFGVAKQPDGRLMLDEKGTVYNEMVRTYESPSTLGWDALGRLVYGSDHPLALSQGGTPEGIRALTPEEIRRFHDAHYQLANMGMVAAFPSSVTLSAVLAKVGEALDALAPASDTRRYMTEADVPPAHVAQPGALRVVDYPYATADQARARPSSRGPRRGGSTSASARSWRCSWPRSRGARARTCTTRWWTTRRACSTSARRPCGSTPATTRGSRCSSGPRASARPTTTKRRSAPCAISCSPACEGSPRSRTGRPSSRPSARR